MPSRDNAARRVLYVVADCPGLFVESTYRIARALGEQGFKPVFAVTSRYYERFKNVALADLGPVHYISDFLRSCPDEEARDVELDYWLTHATFVRTRFFWGKHVNAWDSYRKVVLFFRRLLVNNADIAAVWSETPSNSTLCIAEAEAQRHGVPYLGYLSARIPGHFNVVLDRHGTELLENQRPTSYTPSLEDRPEYMKAATARTPRFARALEGPSKLWRAFQSDTEPSIETGSPARYQIRAFARRLQRRVVRSVLSDSVFSDLPNTTGNELSVLFPLHYRPEASTSVQAPHHEDDVDTIRNIAFSLPHRARLYVKEHPSAIGSHSNAFFRELASFPNVRVLAAGPRLTETLDRFHALVCLTSTAGFEAIQRGIPVLLLGRTFYESYPNVTKVQSWDEMRSALATLSPMPHSPDPRPMQLYLRKCFPGTFNYLEPRVVEGNNIERLVAPLLQTLHGAA